jgi:hypothetical protein
VQVPPRSAEKTLHFGRHQGPPSGVVMAQPVGRAAVP